MAYWLSSLVTVLGLHWIVTCQAQGADVAVAVGQTATLSCLVDFGGQPQVMWLDPDENTLAFNDEVQTDDIRISVEHPYSREWNLVISDVRLSDEGTYKCMINTVPPTEKYTLLSVHYAPTITHSSDDVEALVGDHVTLQCEAVGSPAPTITWYKYTYSGERTGLSLSGSTYNMTNVTRDVAATYECEADNGVLPVAKASIRVDIRFAPEITMPHQQISQEEGKNTVLQCFVATNPANDIYWEKDGRRLGQSPKHRVEIWDRDIYTKTVVLFVFDLHETDFGPYTCHAKNAYGSRSSTVRLFEWQTGHAHVVTPPQDVISGVAENVLFNCTVQGMSHKDILVWWRDTQQGYQQIFQSHVDSSQQNSDSSRSAVSLDSSKYEIIGHYNLLIKNISWEDSGEYMCEIVGRKNHSASLTIVDTVNCSNNNQSIYDINDPVVLSCALNYSGKAPMWHVTWQQSDRKLSGINHDELGHLHREVSFLAHVRDAGSYKCLVNSQMPFFATECQTKIEVTRPQSTPAPHCRDGGMTTVSAMVTVITVATSIIVFLVIITATCCHYRKQIEKLRKTSPSVRYDKNGKASPETKLLTSPMVNDPDV